MVVAMMAGMAVLGVALAVLGEPPGYANPLVEYSPAMLVAVFAVVLPVELGVVGLTGHAFMILSHVAMIGGMVALMIYPCLALTWPRTAATGGRHAIGQEHND
jgi:hypothetical protein